MSRIYECVPGAKTLMVCKMQQAGSGDSTATDIDRTDLESGRTQAPKIASGLGPVQWT